MRKMTVAEAIHTPGTKLHRAVREQRERNRRVDAMTDAERRAYYKRAMNPRRR